MDNIAIGSALKEQKLRITIKASLFLRVIKIACSTKQLFS